jgi:hypothetical protein
MANTITGTELFTAGYFSTNAGKITGEQMFSGGIYRGTVAAAVAIIAYALKMYDLKVKDAQFFPP